MRPSPFSDAFFAELSRSTVDLTAAETLPPACYTDADFYEFEKEALFSREWLCLGRAEWAPQPGDYFTTSIVGEPILIVRRADGQLGALSPVCQHRAAIVAEGRGHADAFVCPYHKWAYDLDGALAAAPGMDRTCGFETGRVRLPPLKLEVWMGFVFVNFDLAAAPLAPRLAAVSAVIGAWDMAAARGPLPDKADPSPFNWKVMLENNNDGYHANKLHRGPLHDFVPSELAWFPDLPADTGGYYRFNGTLHPDASFNPTQKALMPLFPGLSDEQRARVMFANIPPTLSLGFTCDLIMYFILRPNGPQSHEMDFGLLFAPGAMDRPDFGLKLAAINAAMGEITVQDLHVDTLIQVGLRSRFAKRGRYSWQEGAQRLLNGWLVPRYQAAWARAKARVGALAAE
jgi:phenylpropionate dioxygenase-like ring-hydroxylating dioxygenase large terminal subunit